MAASVRPSSHNSRTAEWIFMELDTGEFERQLHIKTRVAGRMRLRIRILSPLLFRAFELQAIWAMENGSVSPTVCVPNMKMGIYPLRYVCLT